MITPRHWDIIAISNKISMPTPANLDSHNGILEESKPPSMGICARMAQLKTNAPNLLNYSPIGLTWGKFGGGYKVLDVGGRSRQYLCRLLQRDLFELAPLELGLLFHLLNGFT